MQKTSRGRMSNADEQFIRDNYVNMSPEQIGEKIGKTAEAVLEKMALLGLKAENRDDRRLGAIGDIRQSVYWNQLRDELTNEEMKLFMEHWKEIISQFKDDIYHTEKIQIMDLVKLEILMSRDLRKEKDLEQIAEDTKKEIGKVEKEPDGDSKKLKLEMLHNRYGQVISIIGDSRSRYEKLAKEKSSLMKSVKGSRDQRIKRLEQSDQNIHQWISAVVDSPDLRRKIGIDMEKMRLAMEVEYERLTDLHQYADGEVDSPILNAEVVSREENNESIN